MDREYIDDQHIVARYLADRLSAPEREQFETYYLEHPDVVNEIEVVARFKVGMSELQRSGELDRLIKTPLRLVWPAVAAAAVVAAIAAGIVFFVNGDSSPVLAAAPSMLTKDGSTLAIGATHRIVRTRRTGHDAQIELDGERRAIELQFLPEYEGSSYRVSVERIAGSEQRPIAEIGGLEADPDGFVRVYLDSDAVRPGVYQLRLITEHGGHQTSLFSLRVKASDRK